MIVRSALAIVATVYGLSFASPVLAGGTTVGGNPDGQGTFFPIARTSSVTPAAVLSAISALTGGSGGATPEVVEAANVLANALNTGAPAAEVDAALTGVLDIVSVGGLTIIPGPGQTPQQAFVQIQAAITQFAAILGLPLTAPSIQTLIALAQQALGA